MAKTVTLDVDSLTLGEMMAAEDASGQDITALLSRSAHRMVLALYIQGLRSSEKPPNWSELANRRVQDVSRSTSSSPQDGDSTP
jgi:hypothetical protein